MKLVAILLLSSLSVIMVVAFPDNHDADTDVPVGGKHVVAVAPAADAGSAAPSSPEADQNTNSIRQPRHLLEKLFKPNTVVVQPIVVQPVAPVYPAYQSNPYYNQGRRYYY
ncbi:hypothetical protein KR018_002310 [Drosophila ironensis]|nr:hypothetical protein KR018_002310 [Drosophila ironensis]